MTKPEAPTPWEGSPEPDRVDEQLVRRNVVDNLTGPQLLSCGAGGGKTRLLVDHYLRLLQESIEPGEIVAVTFTEAAAAELKDRLRAQCRARAADPKLASLTDWKRLAREIESAPVSTIHGFCSALLREHALALGLDPEFGVANATVTSLQLAQLSRTGLLEGLTQDRQEAAILVSQLGLAGAAEQVAAVVQQRGQLGDWLSTPRTAEEIAAAWRAAVEAALPAQIAALVTSAEWVSTRQVLEGYLEAPTSPKMKEACETVLTAVESAQASRTADALGGVLECPSAPRRANSDNDATDGAREAIKSFVNKGGSLGKQIVSLLSLVTQEDDPEAAALTAALLSEARLARAEYDQLQREQSVLDFEDLQLQVRELWRRRPEVLAQVRGRVKHLLVDEFQDTSRLQWDVLGPLAGDGGAVLFVVGDPKQSIYGWRDADLTLWSEVQGDLHTRAPEDGYIQLAKCFRSTPHLLQFFNQLFATEAVLGRPPADEAARLKYAAYYERDLLPERTDGQLPAVELHLVSSPPGACGGAAEEDTEDEDARTGDLRFREALLLAQRVRDLVAGKQPLTVLDRDSGELRPARYGDCALLLRAFGDVGLYEWAFGQAGVPTYVYAGGGFYGAQEIRDVVNGLRAVENQEDEVALVGVLRSPLFGLSDETLFWVSEVGQGAGWWGRLRHCAGEDSPLAEFVAGDELAALRAAVTLLGDLRRRKNRWRLSELIRELLDRTNLAAVLASQRHGGQAVANLQKLVDIAADYETGPRANLRGFVNWLAELEVREEREGQAAIEDEKGNSLKIMTQHSAKGLEWPIVLLPDLNRQGQGDRGVLRWHPDLGCVAFRKQPGREEWPVVGELIKTQREAEGVAEARRLFYVACTRARDHLLLSGCVLVKVSKERPEGRADLKAGRPLAWLTEAFGLTAEGLAEAVIAGKRQLELAGYDSQLITGHLHDQQDLRPLSHTPDTPPPAAAVPVDLARMAARLATIPRDFTARRRFTATELAVYGFCPRRYELTYLQGWPTENIVPPQLNSHDRLSDTERGDVVHHLLRLVGTRGLVGLEDALAGNLGLAPEVEVRAQRQLPELRRQLEGFLHSDLYATVLQDAPELRTEMRVVFPLCPVGDLGSLVAVEGILDAFVATADGNCYVLDYKTGDPADTADSGMYHFQVGLYCAAVQQWRGQLPAQAWLVYLRPEQTQPLPLDPAAIAAEAEAAACARLAAIANAEFTPPVDAPCARCPLRHWCRDCRLTETAAMGR